MISRHYFVLFTSGTHLYVLYESYGFSVASLYSLGFVTGAVTTPITGPLIDKFGRKKSALLYCVLEIGINMLEQYPFLSGLIVSRMVGGVTTNLLSSVFETWLDTEYRMRGFDEKKYEIIMRDSVVVSNMAAIASGYFAHVMAERFGPVGPFQGAVSCTGLALVVVMCLWTENYGAATSEVGQKSKGVHSYLKEAITVFRNDSRILRVGIIQGLTMGSLQLVIFLWSPTLQAFAKSASPSLGLDNAGEPAYGLIFGAFMAAGVAGGLCSSYFRQGMTLLLSPSAKKKLETVTVEGEEVRPMAVELLASSCYLLCALLLLVPCIMEEGSAVSFSTSLGALLVYEFLVGVIMPCEGVIRSLYLPSDARATMMTLPRMIVNLAVSVGVILTRSIA
jgi:MFS family permease